MAVWHSLFRRRMPYRQRTAQGVQDAGRSAAAVRAARLAGTAAAYRGGLSVLITVQLLLWAVEAGAAQTGVLWQAALGLLPMGLLIRYLSGRAWGRGDLRPPWELLLLLPPLVLDAALLLHTLLALLHRLMPSYPTGILRVAVPLLLTGGVLLGREHGTAYGVCLWRRIPALLCLPVIWQAVTAGGIDRLFPLLGDGPAATAGMAAGGIGALWGICLLSAAVPVGADARIFGLTAAGRNAAAGQAAANAGPAASTVSPFSATASPTPSAGSATPPQKQTIAKQPKLKAARIFGLTAAGRNAAAGQAAANASPAASTVSPFSANASPTPSPGSAMPPRLSARLSHTLLPLLLCCAYAFALSCAAPWTVAGDAPAGARLLWLGRTGGNVLISGLGALLWLLCCMLGWCMLLGSAGQLVRRALPGNKLHHLAPLLPALASAAVLWLCPDQLPGWLTGLLPLRILPLGAAAGIAGIRAAIRKAKGSR